MHFFNLFFSKLKHISNAYNGVVHKIKQLIAYLANLLYFCTFGTQLHNTTMVMCVHNNNNTTKGLLIVKVMCKYPLNRVFFLFSSSEEPPLNPNNFNDLLRFSYRSVV